MADLFNQQISATYSGLLKTSSSGVLSASLTQITDGRGNTSPLYLSTDSIQFYGAYSFPSSDGSANQVLKTDGAGVLTWEDDANTGTVTSVALSVPTGLTVTGSPITTNGTITIGGTLGVANGGTGATTLTGILLGNGTSAISAVTDGTVGQVLSTDGSGTYSFIDAGTGDVTVDGASVGNRVAVWNNTTGELRGTSAIATENSNIYLSQPSTNGTDKFNYIIGGAFAINENDFGTQNTGFGHRVFNGADLTGGNNSAFGMESLYSLTTGSHNTSIGSFAMHDNRSGNYNVGLGTKAMFNQRISNYNVAIGYDSMDGVTASQTAVSDYNTAVGYQSLQSIQGGDNNTVIGKDSGNAITTGSNNVIIGSNTGSTIATSSNNIIISDGGGNNRIQVNSLGNVGIGTGSTIYADLEIKRASEVTVALHNSSSITSGNRGNISFYNSSVSTVALIKAVADTDTVGTALEFYTRPVGGSLTNSLTISSGGNVGIGTASPTSILELKETSIVPRITLLKQGIVTWFIGNPTQGNSNNFTIGTDSGGNTEILTVGYTGNVGIGTTTSLSKLNVNNASSGAITRGLGLYNVINGVAGTGVSLDFYVNVGVNDRCARIISTQSTAGNYADLQFQTSDNAAPATRLTITSGGKVIVGTDTTNALEVFSSGDTEIGFSYNTHGNIYAKIIGDITNASPLAGDIAFQTATGGTLTERMRITSGGNIQLDGSMAIGTNVFANTYKLRAIGVGVAQGSGLFASDNGVYNSIAVYSAGADGFNSSATVAVFGKNTVTGRSINAGGTINAGGNDYAEYMTKGISDDINKGDIVGIDTDGLLTNVFSDAISFVIKSTNPSYVGGDTWFTEKKPEKTEEQSQEEFDLILQNFEDRMETLRSKVDRIAFSGQVPCNVMGANVGDYIIPKQKSDGKIIGEAVSDPTFDKYKLSVGKVWKIMEDGRSWVAVKIG